MARARARNSLLSVVFVLAAALLFGPDAARELGAILEDTGSTAPSAVGRDAGNAEQAILDAFAAGRSDLLIEGEGVVEAVLRDDEKGSRHQRFILALPRSGHTVLIAHNIDLAPRIPKLRRGDRVAFRGEYEWNERGGVIHWTHHDPAGRHPGGWLEHEGRRFE